MVEQFFIDPESGIKLGILTTRGITAEHLYNPFTDSDLQPTPKPIQAPTIRYYCWGCQSYITVFHPEHINHCPVCGAIMEFINIRTPRGQDVLAQLAEHDVGKIRWD